MNLRQSAYKNLRRSFFRLQPVLFGSALEAGPARLGDRHFEFGFALSSILKLGTTALSILDVGCAGSVFAPILCECGYKVTGLDIRPWAYRHANFTYLQTDLATLHWNGEPIDVVTAVSTLEHLGLGGRYGEQQRDRADRAAVQRLQTALRPGGHFIVTTPYGLDAEVSHYHRVYGQAQFAALVEGFEIVQQRWFGPVGAEGDWRECSEEETRKLSKVGPEFYSITCALLRKPATASWGGLGLPS